MPPHLLFLTLRTFSATGGIEKVCRVAGKAFSEIAVEKGMIFRLLSMYDSGKEASEPYIGKSDFRGFGGNRIQAVLRFIREGGRSKYVVISHIHLALPGLLIKMFFPKTRIILIAHGIEVWGQQLSGLQRRFLAKADLITAVSSYTQERLMDEYGLKNGVVLNDCLDPYLPEVVDEKFDVRERYGFHKDDFILLTVTRLAFTEVKKNYDNIIRCLKRLQTEIPLLKYLFVGKFDAREKERLVQLAAEEGAADRLQFTGFVPDEDLPSFYQAANLYVMPSKKEGFGLTFIEAAYYGLPVIAGNKDGTTDALLQGRLGTLIDPDSEDELLQAILKVYHHPEQHQPDRDLLLRHFSFDVYKKNWKTALCL